MNQRNQMNHIIYINGRIHRRTAFNCTQQGVTFWADSPESPGVRCSRHDLGRGAEQNLLNGDVLAGGNRYSCWEPKGLRIARILSGSSTPAQDLQEMVESGEITASEATRHLQKKIKCSFVMDATTRELEF